MHALRDHNCEACQFTLYCTLFRMKKTASYRTLKVSCRLVADRPIDDKTAPFPLRTTTKQCIFAVHFFQIERHFQSECGARAPRRLPLTIYFGTILSPTTVYVGAVAYSTAMTGLLCGACPPPHLPIPHVSLYKCPSAVHLARLPLSLPLFQCAPTSGSASTTRLMASAAVSISLSWIS